MKYVMDNVTVKKAGQHGFDFFNFNMHAFYGLQNTGLFH
jgi:hypothetical protein